MISLICTNINKISIFSWISLHMYICMYKYTYMLLSSFYITYFNSLCLFPCLSFFPLTFGICSLLFLMLAQKINIKCIISFHTIFKTPMILGSLNYCYRFKYCHEYAMQNFVKILIKKIES